MRVAAPALSSSLHRRIKGLQSLVIDAVEIEFPTSFNPCLALMIWATDAWDRRLLTLLTGLARTALIRTNNTP